MAVALECDQVFRSSELSLAVSLDCACRLLRTLFLVIILLLSERLSYAIFGGFSTLGTAVGDTLGTSGVSLDMFLFICLSVSSKDLLYSLSEGNGRCHPVVLHWCVGSAMLVW